MVYIKKDKIIQKLSNLPFEYNGDMKIINQRLNKIIKKFPLYENYINNYFKVNKYEYIEDLSLDYNRIPIDCRISTRSPMFFILYTFCTIVNPEFILFKSP